MRRLPLIAFAAFATTVLGAHLALDRARPALAVFGWSRGWLTTVDEIDVLAPVLRRAPIVFAGTSLSGGIAPMLQKRGIRANNRGMPGAHLGDLFAGAIAGERAGAQVIVVELNAFLWNERYYLGTPRPEKPVAREDRRAAAIWPWAHASVRRAIARQLGLDGALAQIAERFAPLRLRASRLTSAWFPPLAARLTPRLAPAPDEPSPDFCENWRRKRIDGIDRDVLEDLLSWRAHAGARVLILLPPLNLPQIRSCGGDAWARFVRLQTWWRARLQAAGAPVIDLTHLVPPHGFADFGHLRADEDYVVIAGALTGPLAAAQGSK